MGAKKKPFYRIVVADAQRARTSGRYIEVVGTYDPLQNPAQVKLDEEKVITWLDRGAQPTQTVRSLLAKHEAIKAHLN